MSEHSRTRDDWLQLVKEQRESRIHVREFCEGKGLNYWTFKDYVREYNTLHPRKRTAKYNSHELCPVIVESEHNELNMHVRINGIDIETDEKTLAAVIRMAARK